MAEETPSPYGGMTVNERLVTSGKMESFEAAALTRDREAMIRILREVDVPSPEWTVDSLLENPSRYGY